MKRKLFVFFSLLMVTVLMVSGCGKSEEEAKKEEKKEVTANTDQETPEKVDTEDVNKETKGVNDFSSLIKYMEKETQGTTKVLYENNEPQVHDMENVTISLDGYTVVALNDFHTDFKIPFGDQTDGGVILAKYTVKNDQDKDVYYMPSLYMTFTGAEKDYGNNNQLLPKEEQLSTELSPTTDYLLKAGEEVTGYFAYSFSTTHLAKMKEQGTVSVPIQVPFAEKGDFGSGFGSKGRFNLALDGEGAEKISSNAAFYEDRVTFENMGEKKMLKEKSDINDSKQLADVNVVLDGYQIAEFTPNAEEAPRFGNFKNGIALLTVKYKLDNKNTSEVDLNFLSTKLTVNNGSQYLRNEGMLQHPNNKENLKPGEARDYLQVFVLDKEQYEKIWKDKAFEMEFGPILDGEAKDISKGHTVTFTLPK
ncbi:DUF5068 domain-containing protein [Lysinibacillus sp. NPDC097287]|uniref:DUF5068 domain-containing protein n=1 Tax=Lysinibacillus sp. NPDC097287 TaxID=3364144 RepID=UPI003827863C